MKKKVIIVIAFIVVLAAVYFFGSGSLKNPSVFIEDFSVSPDGTEITLDVGVSSSAGYVRNVSVYQQFGGKLYLDGYYAFGGINGSIGAKKTFTFRLNDDTTLIALYRNNNCYEEVLVKADDGSWQRAVH